MAILLAYESRGLLIGESALRPVVRSIRTCAERTPGLARVHRVLTMQLGPENVALDAAFEPGLTGERVRQTAERVEESISGVPGSESRAIRLWSDNVTGRWV